MAIQPDVVWVAATGQLPVVMLDGIGQALYFVDALRRDLDRFEVLGGALVATQGADDPVKAVAELNNQYNFLTASATIHGRTP